MCGAPGIWQATEGEPLACQHITLQVSHENLQQQCQKMLPHAPWDILAKYEWRL